MFLLLVVVGLWFLFIFIAPMLVGGGPAKTMSIVNNLRQIELMKQQWALDHGVTGSVRIAEHDLAPYAYGYSSNGIARPVTGERYIIHRSGLGPEAQLTQAYGKLPAGTVIRLRPDTNRLFRIFLPNEQGGANGRQPIRPETNRTPEAAASSHSP
jgi:hypothetical protein